MTLKPRAGVTRNATNQWPHKKDLCLPKKFFFNLILFLPHETKVATSKVYMMYRVTIFVAP